MWLLRRPNPDNFYDGGMPDVNGDEIAIDLPNPDEPPRIILNRRFEDRKEDFQLSRRIAYKDDEFGEILVPFKLQNFYTDLTSVPKLFTWLVPKSGVHLPAALIHDGLVPDRNGPRTYKSRTNVVVDPIDADRVFRDAMHDTGVGFVRRWLVWAAVTIRSLLFGARPREKWPLWLTVWYWLAIGGTVLTVLYLGLAATLEVLDIEPPRTLRPAHGPIDELPWIGGLPWMADLPWIHECQWWAEVLQGLSGAIVIPLGLAVLWGTYYRAGAVAGVALATLVHVTVAVALVAIAYWFSELLTRTVVGRIVVGAAVFGIAATIFVCTTTG